MRMGFNQKVLQLFALMVSCRENYALLFLDEPIQDLGHARSRNAWSYDFLGGENSAMKDRGGNSGSVHKSIKEVVAKIGGILEIAKIPIVSQI